MGRAGTPATMVKGATCVVTTALAPATLPSPMLTPGHTTTPSPSHTLASILTKLSLCKGRFAGGVVGEVGIAVFPMIVVGDDHLAANQHVVANRHRVRASDMTPMADSHVIPDRDPGAENLAPVPRHCLQPEAVASRKVFPHVDVGQTTKISPRANVDLLDAKMGGEHSISHNETGPAGKRAQEDVNPIFTEKRQSTAG